MPLYPIDEPNKNIPEINSQDTFEDIESDLSDNTSSEESEEIHGFSYVEYNDANQISVHVPDDKIPLVMLYGPPTSGKTMLLIRLVRYLQEKGYSASPVRTFRPSADKNYEDICSGFDRMIANDLAAAQTNLISFMLVEICREGKVICRILEVPGEHMLPSDDILSPYPLYFEEITNSNLRKIWLFILEPDWKDYSDRALYVRKIQMLRGKMNSRDRSVFVFNKVDLTGLVIGAGKVNNGEAQKRAKNLYPGIFDIFRNVNPITKFWRSYYCSFVPFQTGSYVTAADGSRRFSAAHQKYCDALWSAILKYIKG